MIATMGGKRIIKRLLNSCFLLIVTISLAQHRYQIETADIYNFWVAYDSLAHAQTKADSINVIQKYYIDQASPEFKEFIRIRNFTSEEYVKNIRLYPKFWETIRVRTEEIENRKSELLVVFKKFEEEFKSFKKPKVCFAIGCLRTGGTIANNLILIGSEIAAADQTVDTSELSNWLQTIMGKTGDITAMIAHETVHTQQINRKKFGLLTAVMNEGIADFIAFKILNKNINTVTFEYGIKNECDLIKDFSKDLKSNPNDYSNWVYNGNRSKDKPADLGYFIGFRIAEAYYEQQKDKKKALNDLLNHKKYERICKESNYLQKDCNLH